MKNKLSFSIIMPTHQRGEVFWRSLHAANEAVKDYEAEIIVINDSKKSKLVLRDVMPMVSIVDNPKNGVASARNLGAKLAKSDFFIFVDDDVIVNKQAIEYTLRLYENNETVCYNPDWIYPPELSEKIKKTQFGRYLIHYGFTSMKGWNHGFGWDDEKAFKVNLIMSNYLPIHKSLFYKINGYNEDFPHAGAEDHDFASRLRAFGITAMVDPKLIVYHNEADRVEMGDWLRRKVRNGETRKLAVQLGYNEVKIEHGFIKLQILLLIIKTKSVFNFLLALIPNKKLFDKIYFKLVNALLAASLYEGYRK